MPICHETHLTMKCSPLVLMSNIYTRLFFMLHTTANIKITKSVPDPFLIHDLPPGLQPLSKRRVPLVEQELLPFRSTWVHPCFSGVRVTQSLVLCVCFVDRCLSFCTFSFGHCVVRSSIYGFWLPPFGIFKLFFSIL
jgi:hypothetical protein